VLTGRRLGHHSHRPSENSGGPPLGAAHPAGWVRTARLGPAPITKESVMAAITSVVLYDPRDTSPEVRTIAGFLAGYSGQTRKVYTLDLRMFYRCSEKHQLALFEITRTHIELYARDSRNTAELPPPSGVAFPPWRASTGTQQRKASRALPSRPRPPTAPRLRVPRRGPGPNELGGFPTPPAPRTALSRQRTCSSSRSSAPAEGSETCSTTGSASSSQAAPHHGARLNRSRASDPAVPGWSRRAPKIARLARMRSRRWLSQALVVSEQERTEFE